MTITELKNYIKQCLGEPYQTVNLSDDQMNNMIERALEKFEDHDEGLEKSIYLLSVTDGTSEYTLPSTVTYVISYYKTGDTSIPLEYRSNQTLYSSIDTDIYVADIITFAMFEQYYKTFDMNLIPKKHFTFNSTTKKLTFETTPQNDEIVGLEIWSTINTELAYTNDWFKEYVVALCQKQYAFNLMKFDSTLPGSTKVNYQLIYDEAKNDIERLEEDLLNSNSAPCRIFIG